MPVPPQPPVHKDDDDLVPVSALSYFSRYYEEVSVMTTMSKMQIIILHYARVHSRKFTINRVDKKLRPGMDHHPVKNGDYR